MTGATASNVLGYQICATPGCESLVLEAIAHKTGGFCVPCCRDGLREAHKTVLVALEGGRYPVSAAKPARSRRNRRKHLARKADPRRIEHRKALEKAKRAAMRRLRAHCSELYDLLLADERFKRGIDPIPVEMTTRPGAGLDAWETMGAVAFYRALARKESATDVPS